MDNEAIPPGGLLEDKHYWYAVAWPGEKKVVVAVVRQVLIELDEDPDLAESIATEWFEWPLKCHNWEFMKTLSLALPDDLLEMIGDYDRWEMDVGGKGDVVERVYPKFDERFLDTPNDVI